MNKRQNSQITTEARNYGKLAVTPEMKKFAQEYSLWVITYGQVYINALSPKFEVDNDQMEIFLSKYHGNNWVKGLVK